MALSVANVKLMARITRDRNQSYVAYQLPFIAAALPSPLIPPFFTSLIAACGIVVPPLFPLHGPVATPRGRARCAVHLPCGPVAVGRDARPPGLPARALPPLRPAIFARQIHTRITHALPAPSHVAARHRHDTPHRKNRRFPKKGTACFRTSFRRDRLENLLIWHPCGVPQAS